MRQNEIKIRRLALLCLYDKGLMWSVTQICWYILILRHINLTGSNSHFQNTQKRDHQSVESATPQHQVQVNLNTDPKLGNIEHLAKEATDIRLNCKFNHDWGFNVSLSRYQQTTMFKQFKNWFLTHSRYARRNRCPLGFSHHHTRTRNSYMYHQL